MSSGREQRQRGLQPEHEEHRAGDGEQQRHDRERGAADVAADHVDVAREQRQRVALAPLVEERQRQRLQVVVDANLEVGDDLLAGIPEQVGVAELEQRLHAEQHQHRGQDGGDGPLAVRHRLAERPR